MQIIVSLYCLGTSDKNRKAGQVQDTHTHYVLSQISLTHSWLTPWHISITTGKASFSVRDSPADSATSLKEIWVGMVMAGEKRKISLPAHAVLQILKFATAAVITNL